MVTGKCGREQGCWKYDTIECYRIKPKCRYSFVTCLWIAPNLCGLDLLRGGQILSGMQMGQLWWLCSHECSLNQHTHFPYLANHYQGYAAVLILGLTLGFHCCSSTDFNGMTSASRGNWKRSWTHCFQSFFSFLLLSRSWLSLTMCFP